MQKAHVKAPHYVTHMAYVGHHLPIKFPNAQQPVEMTFVLSLLQTAMSQMSFSGFDYTGKRKQNRRERLLTKMDEVVLWLGLVALIEPYYSKAGRRRKPYPLQTMLRIHLSQN